MPISSLHPPLSDELSEELSEKPSEKPSEKLAELHRHLQALEQVETQARERQHQAGKLSARERIGLLLDPGTFIELDALVTHRCTDFGMEKRKVPGDGIITGSGKIDGRLVFVFAQDFSVFGGTVSEAGARKIWKVLDLAVENGAPIIALNDGGGARIQEGVAGLSGYGEISWRTVRASGVVPQISAIMGACAGGASYVASLTDFIFMVDKTSYMFITGPEVIRSATGQQITAEGLGGSEIQAATVGTAHFRTRNDADCLMGIRELLSYLPSNCQDDPPLGHSDDDVHRETPALDELVPMESQKPYDIKHLIGAVVDDGRFLEVQPEFAKNMVVGFARFGNEATGIVANQPNHQAGAINIGASLKAARFVRFCDAFNIPIVTFVDTPGFMPGVQEEMNGLIRHGSKLLYAYCEATVPTVTVVVRKAYGGAYGVMGSKHLHCDVNLAYPSAQIAVMGVEAGVQILYRKELKEAGEQAAQVRAQRVEEYRDRFLSPYLAAERGFIDGVILPRHTRFRVTQALRMLRNKRSGTLPRRHTNLPL